MSLWGYMLISVLLIPLSMIGFGYYFAKRPPKKITMVFGYRTAMSMKNKETWDFAHRYCGKIWIVVGWILLPISCIAMLYVFGKNEEIIGTYGAMICCVQVIPVIGSIILTEVALKKTFDKSGNRIE